MLRADISGGARPSDPPACPPHTPPPGCWSAACRPSHVARDGISARPGRTRSIPTARPACPRGLVSLLFHHYFLFRSKTIACAKLITEVVWRMVPGAREVVATGSPRSRRNLKKAFFAPNRQTRPSIPTSTREPYELNDAITYSLGAGPTRLRLSRPHRLNSREMEYESLQNK